MPEVPWLMGSLGFFVPFMKMGDIAGAIAILRTEERQAKAEKQHSRHLYEYSLERVWTTARGNSVLRVPSR